MKWFEGYYIIVMVNKYLFLDLWTCFSVQNSKINKCSLHLPTEWMINANEMIWRVLHNSYYIIEW